MYYEKERYNELIETSKLILDMDKTDETACRFLMQGLSFTGRNREAVKEFKILTKNLKSELGVSPEHLTVRLKDEIMSRTANYSV